MAKKKQYDDDDGRVIAPMNVDGMPWYVAHKSDLPEEGSGEQPELNTGEKFAFLRGVLLAVLLVGGVFVGAYFLLIALLDFAMTH